MWDEFRFGQDLGGWDNQQWRLGAELGVRLPVYRACPGAAANRAEVNWAPAVADARPGAPRWLHGDLHPANVVVWERTLSGVIDFI
jgi:aminoglycoside phosphotransferase (APT) family kinase protein